MNGRPANPDRRVRGIVGNLAWFFRDLLALTELQVLLFLVDAVDEFRKARLGLFLILIMVLTAGSCIPLGLAGLALVLADTTGLTMGQSLMSVAGSALLLAFAGISISARWINPGSDCLQRSRAEWYYNVHWLKETLISLGENGSTSSGEKPERLRR